MTIHTRPWGEKLFEVRSPDAPPFQIKIGGRLRWALEALISAGQSGCTPIEKPGPRWSDYVHRLRALGLPIETKTERHGGPFPGCHARYVLKASVLRIENEAAA